MFIGDCQGIPLFVDISASVTIIIILSLLPPPPGGGLLFEAPPAVPGTGGQAKSKQKALAPNSLPALLRLISSFFTDAQLAPFLSIEVVGFYFYFFFRPWEFLTDG